MAEQTSLQSWLNSIILPFEFGTSSFDLASLVVTPLHDLLCLRTQGLRHTEYVFVESINNLDSHSSLHKIDNLNQSAISFSVSTLPIRVPGTDQMEGHPTS